MMSNCGFYFIIKKMLLNLKKADNNSTSKKLRGWYPQMGRVRALVEASEMFRRRGRGQSPLSTTPGGHGRPGPTALLHQLVFRKSNPLC